MMDVTFLSEEQIFGPDRLEIFEKYGTKSAMTDFAIILGGYVYKEQTSEPKLGSWFTETKTRENDVIGVDSNGRKELCSPIWRDVGIRPAVKYSTIKSNCTNIIEVSYNYDLLEVEYGEYPAWVAEYETSKTLEKLFQQNLLSRTGRIYTTDSIKSGRPDNMKAFQPRSHIEFELFDKKYIRIIGDEISENKVLSDDQIIQKGNPYWICVEKIKWIVDEKNDIALTKNIICSGIQFNDASNYKADFKSSSIKKFLDDCWSKEIIADQNIINQQNQTSQTKTKKTIRRKNTYEFEFNSVTEEDIIKGAVQSDIAVFLHGRSSEGKSARVKQLDPDCEIIYLRNATPDSLNGKSVYNSNTGEMIDVPPTWFQKVQKKCMEEPDKIHIIFFDELTNA